MALPALLVIPVVLLGGGAAQVQPQEQHETPQPLAIGWAAHRSFNFPFLYDGETQEIYGPVATPHLFLLQGARAAPPDDDYVGQNAYWNRKQQSPFAARRPPPVSKTHERVS